MPGLSGWGFLDRLKAMQGNLAQMDIYILSAFSNSQDREMAKWHPMVKGYYDKPLTKSVLKRIFLADNMN